MNGRRDPSTHPADETSRPDPSIRMPRALVSRRRVAIATLFALGLASLGWIGLKAIDSARSWLHDRPEYAVPFDRIVLDPPPPEFLKGGAAALLDRVREGAGITRPIRFLDQDLADLGLLFAKHSPWVARVDRVERPAVGRVVVRLTYRRPTARIELGPKRFVALSDDGVVLPGEDILPKYADRLLLIRGYRGTMSLRPGLFLGAETSGQVLPEEAALVSMARQIHDHQTEVAPRVVLLSVEQAPIVWVWTRQGHGVLWGRLVDDPEEAGPTVAERLERLARWEDANPAATFSAKEYLQFTKDGIERRGKKPPAPREDPS